MGKTPAPPKKKKGFISELVGNMAIAIVVMIVLIVFVFPLFSGSSKNLKLANKELEAISGALEQYHSETGAWPANTNSSVSSALVQKSPAGKPWLDHERRDGQGRLLDPWEKPYQFFLSNDGYIVRSAGPDGEFTRRQSKSKGDDLYFSGE